jgi:hypothetical protein
MKTSLICRISMLAILPLAATPAAAATLSALATFGGGDGYLAPGDRTYLTTDNNQRGMAYNSATGHLLVVNRTGGLSVNVIDGASGADVGTLNQGSGVITGGTFAGSMIAAADDGAIYMANLTTNATTSPFKVYRWASEAATPTLAFSGAPLAGARLGDSLDATGSGAATRQVAGYKKTPALAGNNSFALLSTADGTSFTGADVAVTGPAAGDFKFGVTFTDGDTVIGKSGANGRVVDVTGPSAGTLNTSFTLDSSSINPMDFAVVGGVPLLASVEASASVLSAGARLFVYDMSNPSAPVRLAELTAQPGASNANGNGVGQVRFGALGPTSAVIYAMSTNNGIQAFQLTGVPEPATWAMLAAGLTAMAVGRSRPRG